MDCKDKRKSEEAEELESVAEEMEWRMDQRDQDCLQAERDQQEDLNQGMQTGTHDSPEPSINWGPSYRIKKSTPKPKWQASIEEKDRDAKD
jgi:hypothetical protein